MSQPKSLIMTSLPMPATAPSVARWVAEVRRSGIQGYFGQIAGIVRYARATGRVTPLEYYYYHLYDRDRRTEAECRLFIGHRGRRRIVLALNSMRAGILGDDKLVTYGYLKGLGFPTPATRALIHAFRTFGDVPTLHDRTEIEAYLQSHATFPMFGKPLGKSNALGVASLQGREGSHLLLTSGRRIPIGTLIDSIMSFLPRGYIFMDHLQPHPDMVAVCGDRLGTIRVYVLREDNTPTILGVLWKITCGANMADNFHLSGNLLGALDPDTGVVTRVVGGSGPDEREFETHPDTGARLIGFAIPRWHDLIGLVRRAALAFPLLPYQAWDIAVTPHGPVFVELNSAGDVSLWQRAMGRGIMNDRLRAILEKRGR